MNDREREINKISEKVYIVGKGKDNNGSKYDILAKMLEDEYKKEGRDYRKEIEDSLTDSSPNTIDVEVEKESEGGLEVVSLQMVKLKPVEVNLTEEEMEEAKIVTIVGEGLDNDSGNVYSSMIKKIVDGIKRIETVEQYEEFNRWLKDVVSDNQFEYYTKAVLFTAVVYLHNKISNKHGVSLTKEYKQAQETMKTVEDFDSLDNFVMPVIQGIRKSQLNMENKLAGKNKNKIVDMNNRLNQCLIDYVKVVFD